jgi:quercetin dioxygenase-like cupin family protein
MNTKSNFACPISIAPNISRRMSGILRAFLILSCAIASASAAEPGRVTELMTKALVNVPGKEVTMITVDYPPGATDPVHRHYASAFVYVLEGSIVMQMKGGKKLTLHPGQTFYEDPNGIHLIGRNASDTKPAKFLVVLVKDKGAPILVPVNK